MSRVIRVVCALVSLFLSLFAENLYAICPSGPFDLTNVTWQFADSLATCPAGDSLAFAHSALHPHSSRLRVIVGYFDEDCNPRVGVRPESL